MPGIALAPVVGVALALMLSSANTSAAAIDGTFTDTTTRLSWKRCSEGQRWTQGACAGQALLHTRDEAQAMAEVSRFDGHRDWRLPTLDELRRLHRQSIAELGGVAGSTYWTATAMPHGTDGGFVVGFDGAADYQVAAPSEGHALRLVRDVPRGEIVRDE